MKSDVSNKKDIEAIVKAFYEKIKINEIIGQIFKNAIQENHWNNHLDKLSKIWDTNLFGAKNYRGNPVKTHQTLDHNNEHSLSQIHFFEWLKLWNLTIDEKFEGINADHLKQSARHISTRLFLHIFKART